MESFFTSEDVKTTTTYRKSGCGGCGLHRQCKSSKMQASGKGEKGILIIADAPNEAEDRQDQQFIDEAGQMFRRKLRWQGIDLENDCRVINAIRCHKSDKEAPTANEIECCRGNVWQEIEVFKPQLILLMGTPAVHSFLQQRWHHDDSGLGSIVRWRGWGIPDRDVNAWVVPMFPPSYVFDLQENNGAVMRLFELDLIKAMKLLDTKIYRPLINETAGVEIIENQVQLCERLAGILEWERLMSFDYETTGLKPHRNGHEIICCSIAVNGDSAIAFGMPKQGTKALYLFKQLLMSKQIGKMAHNMKTVEDHWSNIILKTPVNNWVWDSMIAAHVLDNREGTTGLKFQAYVNFGVLDYSSSIYQYLRAEDYNSFNRIKEAPWHELLIYNGIDSLLEFRLSMQQMEALGAEIPI